MGWSQLPGFEPDRRVRNLAVGIGYLLVAPLAIVCLPLLVFLAVTVNYREVAGHLSQLPGITPDGGAKAGLIASGGLFVLWGLLLVGGGGAFGPGAADGDQPAEAPADEFDPDADRTLSSGEIRILFETTLERGGTDLRAAESNGDVFEVAYQHNATTETEFLERMGYVTGAYVGAVGEGLETTRMEATVFDGDEQLLTWHVDSEWATAYHDDELTMDDVIERSLATADEIDASDAEDAVDGEGETALETDDDAEAAASENETDADTTGAETGSDTTANDTATADPETSVRPVPNT